MTEATLKDDLVETFRKSTKGYVVLRHEDRWTSGIPDMSVTGFRRTSWWEVKYANPDFKTKGIQELTMLRLAQAGIAFYIIYAEKPKGVKHVSIVRPSQLADWESQELFSPGFNHRWVIDMIKRQHEIL